jgi:hypothetical protein
MVRIRQNQKKNCVSKRIEKDAKMDQSKQQIPNNETQN